MRFLASYLLKGEPQAIVVTSVTAVLSLIFFPLSYFSIAAVALVGLKIGDRAAVKVTLFSALASGLLLLLLTGTIIPAVIFTLMMWLPVFWIARQLRRTGSMGGALLHSGALGTATIVGFYLFIDNPAQWWYQLMQESLLELMPQLMEPERGQLLLIFEGVAPMMTGVIALALMMHWIGGLLIARWWQAMIYNPGGFGSDYRQLFLGRAAALISVILLLISILIPMQLVQNLLFVAGFLLMLQGIAVVHAVVRQRNWHRAWLIGLYLMLLVAMPQTAMLLALTGLMDNWYRFRTMFPAAES